MWESQIQQLTWEPEPRPDSQLWKWTFLLELGTWLCFQQGPYFIAQFWESALSKPGSRQQVSVRSCLLLVLVLSSRIFIVSWPGPPWPVSLSPVALIDLPVHKIPVSRTKWPEHTWLGLKVKFNALASLTPNRSPHLVLWFRISNEWLTNPAFLSWYFQASSHFFST